MSTGTSWMVSPVSAVVTVLLVTAFMVLLLFCRKGWWVGRPVVTGRSGHVQSVRTAAKTSQTWNRARDGGALRSRHWPPQPAAELAEWTSEWGASPCELWPADGSAL